MSHQQQRFPADLAWRFADLWKSGIWLKQKPPRPRTHARAGRPHPQCELSVSICPLALHKFVRAATWLARAPMQLRSGCIAGLAASLWRSA